MFPTSASSIHVNPMLVGHKMLCMCNEESNAYIYDKSQKEGPVQILSRVWISCSLELEVWSEFELI
jgi:hypothetical protein